MSVSRPFDDAYLLKYSDEHVSYEVKMLFGMVELLTSAMLVSTTAAPIYSTWNPTGSGKISLEHTDVKNALIECFAMHLRNIIEFLYPPRDKPRDTDVAAEDFFLSSSSWIKLRADPMTPVLKDAYEKASKRIAHLTTDRVSGSQWDVKGPAKEVGQLLKRFVENAENTRLSGKVGAWLGPAREDGL
jgi:hypothetical protein